MKALLTILLLSITLIGFAQIKKESPYLEINTPGALISLKSSETDVHISGTIAHVKITQIYHNKGNSAIEANYVFPLSTQAAVHKMDMTIGNRTIHAKIFEKQDAQKVYKKAISEGKRAAKLDQHSPNVFQMNVGNIMPDDTVQIDIYYTELLVPINGEYQFVAPSVVGPRFTGESTKSESIFNNSYVSNRNPSPFHYNLSITINAGVIIQNINCSSHRVDIHYPDSKTAELALSKNNNNSSNRDFILNYSLRGDQVQSGLLLYEHEDENFFAYIMEPTKQPKSAEIPAREYLFIVDVSGSMNGYPLEISKSLMRNLLCNLRPNDLFNVQLFASSSTIFSPVPVTVTGENIEDAIRFLSRGQGSGGGTRLLSALKNAYKLPRKDSTSARSMVVITDGYVSIEKEAFKLIQDNLDKANVFTFGIGSSVNRYLIEGLAKVSHSESFIATNKKEAQLVALDFEDYISSPLVTQIKFKTNGFDTYAVSPKSIPDVFAARPVVIFGKYKGKAKGEIIITGFHGQNKFKTEYVISDGILSDQNIAIRYLWARNKIAQLDDYSTLFNQNVEKRVTELGLQYNLLTQYTSFVAVDDHLANHTKDLKTVTQTLPAPQGMSASAVGAEASIKESTRFKKSYKMRFTSKNDISSSEKRQLRMWFKATYSNFINKHLKDFKGIRFKFNADGQLVYIESLLNKQWMKDENLMEAFSMLPIKRLKLSNTTEITITN